MFSHLHESFNTEINLNNKKNTLIPCVLIPLSCELLHKIQHFNEGIMQKMEYVAKAGDS